MTARTTERRTIHALHVMTACVLALAACATSIPPALAEALATERADALAVRRGKSIQKGLDWLGANLPSSAAKTEAGDSAAAQHTAILSLSGMAFLASNEDLQHGRYHVQFARCLDAVLADSGKEGLIAPARASASMYHHGYATLFLAEAYMRTHDQRIKPRLESAVKLIEVSQSPSGGWRYTPTPLDGDVSVSACILNGLAAARAAGIRTSPETIKKATEYMLSCRRDDGGFAYLSGRGSDSGPARTAAAAAALRHVGGQDDAVRAAIKYLAAAGGKDADAHQSYRRYYESQLYDPGDPHPLGVIDAAKTERIESQQADDGSWDSHTIGKSYDTACALLTLQSPEAGLWIFSMSREPAGQN